MSFSPSSEDWADLRPVPAGWEKAARCLPRGILDWVEIRGRPAPISDEQHRADLDFWRDRRVALVRQSAYPALYAPRPVSGWEQRVLSAGKHLGPFAFLSELGADYWVVRHGSEPETHAWREKYASDPDPVASVRAREEAMRAWEESTDGAGAVTAGEIPWNRYDLVVGLDVPVPAHLVKKNPRTLWAYFSTEAGGSLHKTSLLSPRAGYHLYLNHGFRRFRVRPGNRAHVLEFPFTFQSARGWDRLGQAAGADPRQPDQVVLDRASPPAAPVGDRLRVRTLGGTSAREPACSYVRVMRESAFAVRTDPRPRWGNWAGEAVQAGCLFLGRRESLAMAGLLIPGLICPETPSAIGRIHSWLARPEEFQRLRDLQSSLGEHLCFRRPLAELTRRARQFFAG